MFCILTLFYKQFIIIFIFYDTKVYVQIICVQFTYYTICIIFNHVLDYSTQYYSYVRIPNNKIIIPICKQLQWMPLLTISLQYTV